MQEEQEESKDEASEAMDIFFRQFGPSDIYTQIVLEEFFKELLR
jgi:hypothetical protein